MAKNGYTNTYGEVSNYLVHADVNYANVNDQPLDELNALKKDIDYPIELKRNVWFDAQGTEHSRKAAGRDRRSLLGN